MRQRIGGLPMEAAYPSSSSYLVIVGSGMAATLNITYDE